VFGQVHTFPSVMAQNFWIAIFAFASCFLVTVVVSLVTAQRKESELEGLVYGLTKIRHDENARWFERPVVLAVFVLVLAVILNVWFA
jgi:SSS family solute:Na+ symporter